MGNVFVCPKCGNKDPRYIGFLNGKPYCRRCIEFIGSEVFYEPSKRKNVIFDLGYKLSAEQRQLSEKIIQNFKDGIDTLIYAVCGSGKTEISYGVIEYAMSLGLKVGFALPRRDVVIELYYRLKSAFPFNKIVPVYGGHTSCLEGDCVILTTHQLYRYEKYFDLIVMDEVDAFPFKGSEVLLSFFHRALRGHSVLMSATPSRALVAMYRKPGKNLLTLHTRFHKFPIPVPRIVKRISFAKTIFVVEKLTQYRKEKKPCLVFVPTISMASSLFTSLSIFVTGGNYVSSKKKDRPEVISGFKEGKYLYLVTTAVLERGVTISNCQIIVYGAESKIYDAAALVQIAGRAGRKKDHPDGDVFFLCDYETEAMRRAIHEIEQCNKYL